MKTIAAVAMSVNNSMSSSKQLLSAFNRLASRLKRRSHAVCIYNIKERHHHLRSFACMVSVNDELSPPPQRLGVSIRHGTGTSHNIPTWGMMMSPTVPSLFRSGDGFQRVHYSFRPSIRSTCIRFMSYHSNQEQMIPPPALADITSRVSELERVSEFQRLTKHDVHNHAWPLLSDCVSSSSISFERNNKSTQQELLERAKLSSRILELCLKDVEVCRVTLWEWLQNLDDTSNDREDSGTGNNGGVATKFSPTAYWEEAPHPTKEMFTLAISAWKHVIESCSSFSIKSTDAMELMESSAQQVSSLLSLMEDEYSSDAAFILAYNSKLPKGRYSALRTGAILPDVRNYSEVIGAWGKCIDGSVLRQPERSGNGNSHHPNASSRHGTFEKRLQLEAAAMKSMMELLESMEEDLYETFSSESTSTNSIQRKRPPPDRFCYNIILASMARQVNPSLYEMRLVLQRMMERVQFELEHPDNEEHEADYINEQAMSFFPDVYSYNALIEARSNRAAMFASDKQQQQPRQFSSHQLKHHAAWQQGQDGNLLQRKRRFTASEEEAILAEQTLDEMGHLATMSVRPDTRSYNAVMKAWIKTGSERGLQRAVMILRSLALNGHKGLGQQDKEMSQKNTSDNAKDQEPSVFARIARWGASLLGKENVSNSEEISGRERHVNQSTKQDAQPAIDSEALPITSSKSQSQPEGVFTNIGMAGRLSHLHSATSTPNRHRNRERQASQTRIKKSHPRRSPEHISVGISSRMALMQSAVQGDGKRNNGPLPSVSSHNRNENEYVQHTSPEPIGPMPSIETNVAPDINTFNLVIHALERQGTATSAELADDLLHLLGKYYSRLNQDIAIYNSVLNAYAKAAKNTSDVRLCLDLAKKADALLCSLLESESDQTGTLPQPTEYTFLMAINTWANVAATAVSSGKSHDGQFAALHAEDLLKKLQKFRKLQTTTATACYGAVIRTWASLGNAEHAQKVLDEMIANSGRLPLNLIYFNAVLDAWARVLASSSSDRETIIGRLSSIRDLVLRMNSRGGHEYYNVDSDASSFNHVIRACYAPWSSSIAGDGKESIRHAALDIAYDTFTKMSQNSSHKPDAHTYAHMFKAIACLLPSTDIDPVTHSDKYGLCKTIFHICCRDGQLTKSTLWTLRKMFSVEDDFAELLLSELDNLGDGRMMGKEQLLMIPESQLFHNLPNEWGRYGRNVKSLNRHRQ